MIFVVSLYRNSIRKKICLNVIQLRSRFFIVVVFSRFAFKIEAIFFQFIFLLIKLRILEADVNNQIY